MAEFPAAPMSPAAFIEGWLPRAFADAGLPPGSDGIDVKLGVQLAGDGGGEWVFHVAAGGVRVARESREETAFTFVQSVADWSGALWAGKGGAIGAGAAAFFKPGALGAASGGGQLAAAPSPAALAELSKLTGLLRMVVAGGAGGEWSVGFKLGPGAIPVEATCTLTLQAADAEAMARGELDPMQAFLGGKLAVTGDMTLMLQVQAAQMQAAAKLPPRA